MRLFTAIELSEAVREHAAALVAELQRRVHRTAPGARVTWIPPERMHLTVRFIGDVDGTQAERIVSALRAPLPMPAFVARFEGLGAFPPRGEPRVIWLGVAEGRAAVQQAEASIGERLRALGIADEERPYNPHLTLARVREASGVRAAALFKDLPARAGETQVEAITLFESRLSPKGSTYTVLEKTSLDPRGRSS